VSRLSGFYAETTWNPSSILDGAQTNLAVTVQGARVGDFVMASLEVSQLGTVISGYVGSDDTVTVILQNLSGVTRDLGNGTLRVAVVPKAIMMMS